MGLKKVYEILKDERGVADWPFVDPTPEERIYTAYTKAAEEIKKVLCEAAKPLFEGSDPITFTVCASNRDVRILSFSGLQLEKLMTKVTEYVSVSGESPYKRYGLVLQPNGIFIYQRCHHIYDYGPEHLVFDSEREVSSAVYCIIVLDVLATIKSWINYRAEKVNQTVS